MKIEILNAQKEDAKQLADVFNLSFYNDYVKYGECPGFNKTEEKILKSMKKYAVFKIVTDEKIVGAISVHENPGNTYFLGALCVIPEFANKGIGQEAMCFLDTKFPNATHWSLETPSDKMQNHYFYKKFGYTVTKEYLDGNVLISYFERQC